MSEEMKESLEGLYNAADETQVKKRKRKEDRDQEQRLADLKAVLSTPEGRRFWWRVVTMCGLFQQSYRPDSHLTAFNEGVRKPGLELLAEITAEFPDLYLLTQGEAFQNAKKEKANG